MANMLMSNAVIHCTCRTCRDFDWTTWSWTYLPVRYRVTRQSLVGLLRWLDRVEVQP